ncbi:PREDICTED: polyamine-modulated factor 1-binding protein 1-like [Cyphomyrmex costatus]|uniref:Laminin subunit alpha-2 n=1 Tax=Cyphomyrmex costatus TaxID=456900 RepID=A0A195CSB7_9HYME|nr:PREDICTED: polyamine-modulated factor 1-binding protein 1-like [Cyphomyrmex costatus]KYN03540.1 hypothetical protein ALC62_05667 [Cyphomyrmex costatus]
MVRVALLVTVLAALCYGSQATPLQIGNKEIDLTKTISDKAKQLLDYIPDGVKDTFRDISNKITERIGQLEKDFQEKRQSAVNAFEKATENAKKLLQEGKQNLNEALENLKKVKQEIEANYQDKLNERIQNIKYILDKLTNEDLKQKVKEKINSLKDQVKETFDRVLRRKQSGVETFGIESIIDKGKNIWKNIHDKFTEKSNNIMNDVNKATNELKENVSNTLQKSGQVEALKIDLSKSLDKFRETIKNIKEIVKRSIKEQIQQSGFFDTIVGEARRGTKNAGSSGIESIRGILNGMESILESALGTKEDVKGDTKGDTTEDTEEDTKNNTKST